MKQSFFSKWHILFNTIPLADEVSKQVHDERVYYVTRMVAVEIFKNTIDTVACIGA
jgi:hypothetical protein